MNYKHLSRGSLFIVPALFFSAISPVGAQESSSSSSSIQAVEETLESETTNSETTVPAPSIPVPETAAPTETTTPPVNIEETPTPVDETLPTEVLDGTEIDPLVNEAPAESTLEPGKEAPGPVSTYGQAAYTPPAILQSSVVAAESRLAAVNEEFTKSIEIVRSLRLRQKKYDVKVESIDVERKQVQDRIAAMKKSIQDRAVAGFVSKGVRPDISLGIERDSQEKITELRMGYLMDIDNSEIEKYQEEEQSFEKKIDSLGKSKKAVDVLVLDAEDTAMSVKIDRDQAEIEYEAFKAGSQVYVEGVVFPIAGTYSYPLIDSYGFPRMPGTADAHWHEGIDIFAPRGTPLVTAEGGTVTDVGVGRLGGLKVWVQGRSGTKWYYAHLEDFAPGLAEGQVLNAGDLIGYIGDTGNAVGTPPHVHLEMHPGGGDPVNPYPLLNIVAETDRKNAAAGMEPNYVHAPLGVTTTEVP